MVGISRTMTQDLGPEIANVKTKHLPLPHRAITARRCPNPAPARQHDRTERRQPPGQVRILAVELDGLVEAADACERIPADGEIAAVKNRAETKAVMNQDMGGRRDDEVVRANQRPAEPVPVIKA